MQAIAPFVIASLLIELTPGPNMTYLALVGVTVGRRAGYAATIGVTLGLALLGLAAALGLAALITASPLIYETLRWLGVLYFVYLAWDAWRDGTPSATIQVESDTGFFLRGLISNLLNPQGGDFLRHRTADLHRPRAAAGRTGADTDGDLCHGRHRGPRSDRDARRIPAPAAHQRPDRIGHQPPVRDRPPRYRRVARLVGRLDRSAYSAATMRSGS
jgi:hypothetical protein